MPTLRVEKTKSFAFAVLSRDLLLGIKSEWPLFAVRDVGVVAILLMHVLAR